MNIGHDDAEVVAGFKSLVELFEGHKLCKSFIVTDYGAIERFMLSSLQNIDEQVMLSSCNAIDALIRGKDESGVQDVLIKRQGIHALKTCAMDEMIEIRLIGLQMMSYLSSIRPDVQKLINQIGILELCLQYIQNYPDELIDADIVSTSLDILQSVLSSSKNIDSIIREDDLNSIAV